MGLERIHGSMITKASAGEIGIPEMVVITVKDVEAINKVYSMIKDDENFILEEDKKAILVVTNPLAAKLENGEIEIIDNK